MPTWGADLQWGSPWAGLSSGVAAGTSPRYSSALQAPGGFGAKWNRGEKNKASCRHKKFKSISTCFQLISPDDSCKQPRLVVPVNYSKPHTSFAAEWCKRMCGVPISQSDWEKGMRHHWVTFCFPHGKGEAGRGCSWPHSTATLSPGSLTSSWGVWWTGCKAGLIRVILYLKTMSVMAFSEGSGLHSCTQINNPKDTWLHSLLLHHRRKQKEEQAPWDLRGVHHILRLPDTKGSRLSIFSPARKMGANF